MVKKTFVNNSLYLGKWKLLLDIEMRTKNRDLRKSKSEGRTRERRTSVGRRTRREVTRLIIRNILIKENYLQTKV